MIRCATTRVSFVGCGTHDEASFARVLSSILVWTSMSWASSADRRSAAAFIRRPAQRDSLHANQSRTCGSREMADSDHRLLESCTSAARQLETRCTVSQLVARPASTYEAARREASFASQRSRFRPCSREPECLDLIGRSKTSDIDIARARGSGRISPFASDRRTVLLLRTRRVRAAC